MRHLRDKMGGVAAATVLALTLAACGGGDDPSSEPATDTGAEQTQSPAETQSPDETQSPTDSGTAAAGEGPFTDLKVAADAVGFENNAKALASGIIEATGMEGSTDQAALQAYANLSQLLQEHVYLAGIAVDAGLSFGLDSPQFEAAAATLDQNSVELADFVGTVAPDKRDQFLSLWREHIGFFVTYAEGAATDSQELKDQAIQNLNDYRQQSGAFFEEISGGAIPADAVASELHAHVETLTAAIDALAAGDADAAFTNLKEAATAVGEDGAAKALATGIAEAAGLEGNVDSQAAVVYAKLSTLLEEHVYLTGVGVKTAFTAGLDSEAFAAAEATLDTNSVELADLVGTVAPDQRDAFLELWRQHIGFFVNYAKGAATGDQELKDQALNNLDQYRSQAGSFFEEISGGAIPSDAVADGLDRHVETLTAAIDSFAAALVE